MLKFNIHCVIPHKLKEATFSLMVNFYSCFKFSVLYTYEEDKLDVLHLFSFNLFNHYCTFNLLTLLTSNLMSKNPVGRQTISNS
jgi:hypothetical protein